MFAAKYGLVTDYLTLSKSTQLVLSITLSWSHPCFAMTM